MSISIVTYKDRDNVTGLRLTASREVINPSLLTRIELISRDVIVSTDSDPELFELTDTEIRVKLGLSPFPVGRQLVRLVAYDPINTAGITFGDINLTVIKRI